MARSPRTHAPGSVFHLTTRTQGKVHLFTDPLKPRIVDQLATVIRTSDVLLLGYAIMSNHLHVMVRQGWRRLGRTMQPFLTRVARLVGGAHGIRGHIFEGRYRDTLCSNPWHVRTAIAYMHLNPVRAGIVADPGDFACSSHNFYATGRGAPAAIGRLLAAEAGLSLFAPTPGLAVAEQRAWYSRHIASILATPDADPRPDFIPASPLQGPFAASLFQPWTALDPDAPDGPFGRRPLGSDLHGVAERLMHELAPKLDPAEIRSGTKRREVVRARRKIIRRLDEAGFAGQAIARYLRISPQTVSSVIVAARRDR